jgi:nitrogenase molybdenum-iron protein alpha/beta subunit
MKGLRKVLTPFAPDQSGASGVLYSMGALIVIIDAGGCTGNVCGFDEPRWHESRSAVFSAGLRDMDAILGRDELLASKIKSACDRIDTSFVAVIGTPVPATIGTDYKALKKLIESKIDIPVLPVITNGMKLYNEGEKLAYKALIDEFASDTPAYRDRIVIGMTPLTYGRYHEDLSLDDIRNIRGAGELIAASSSGIDACEYLGKDFMIVSPLYKDNIPEGIKGRTLVCHDEVVGKTIRDAGVDCDIATFFKLHDIVKQDGDKKITEEDEFIALVRNGGYDTIAADICLKELVPDFEGRWVDLKCFAISGRL